MALRDSSYFSASAWATAPTDLNTLVLSGFYRLNSGHTNVPAGVSHAWGQVIVSRNNDTVLQILSGHNSGLIFFRQGNPVAAGGNGGFGPWRPMGQKPVRYVDDTNGYMYGETQGGLNTVNIFRFANKIDKFMPANPVPGDEVIIIVTNGRTDNAIL